MTLKTRIIAAFLVCLMGLMPVSAGAAVRAWEQVKTERSDARSIAREQDVEVKIASGVIMVSSNTRITVKVYTILGQLISQDTIGPGQMQMRPGAHGVYIVKAGSLTCKVAL